MKNILKIILIFFLLSATASAATFTGYYNLSQTLSSGQYLTLPAGAERVDVSVGGEVPVYVGIVEDNVSTYPAGAVLIMPMYNSTNIITGNSYTSNNVVYDDGVALFDGATTSIIATPFSTNLPKWMHFELNTSGASNVELVSRWGSSGNRGYAISHMSDGKVRLAYTTDGINQILVSSTGTLPFNQEGKIDIVFNSNSVDFYIDGVSSGSSAVNTSTIYQSTQNMEFGMNRVSARYNGSIDTIYMRNSVPTIAEILQLKHGFSGIQLNGEGYSGGTLTLDGMESVEYVATDGIARTVYGSAEYTDNVTVLDETNDGYYYSVNLSHQAGSNVTSGTITYDTGRPSLTGMEFSSTNPSATYTTEGSLLIISTGALTSEDTYTYSLALPTYSVSGHVTCDEELNGIEGATVTLNGFSATTNATGYYVFPSVTNGTYTVTASKTGYDPASKQITVSGQDVTVDDICIHFVTQEQAMVRNTIPLFMAIVAILGAGLMIGAGMVFYTAMNGKSGVSFKQMKEIGYGAIFLIIFLLAVVMMGAAVYR